MADEMMTGAVVAVQRENGAMVAYLQSDGGRTIWAGPEQLRDLVEQLQAQQPDQRVTAYALIGRRLAFAAEPGSPLWRMIRRDGRFPLPPLHAEATDSPTPKEIVERCLDWFAGAIAARLVQALVATFSPDWDQPLAAIRAANKFPDLYRDGRSNVVLWDVGNVVSTILALNRTRDPAARKVLEAVFPGRSRADANERHTRLFHLAALEHLDHFADHLRLGRHHLAHQAAGVCPDAPWAIGMLLNIETLLTLAEAHDEAAAVAGQRRRLSQPEGAAGAQAEEPEQPADDSGPFAASPGGPPDQDNGESDDEDFEDVEEGAPLRAETVDRAPAAPPPERGTACSGLSWRVLLPYVDGTSALCAEYGFRYGGKHLTAILSRDGNSYTRRCFNDLDLLQEGNIALHDAAHAGLRARWPRKWVGYGGAWVHHVDVQAIRSLPRGVAATGNSVTLGLALGLLMAAARTADQRVIATGDVENNLVRPIDGLRQKIEAVLAEWPLRRRGGEHVAFFVPYQTLDGKAATPGTFWTATMEGYRADLERIGVDLIPVATLSEARDQLKARTLAPLWVDHALNAACIAGMVAVAVAGGAQWIATRPITATLIPIAAGDGSTVPTPYRSTEDDRGAAADLCGQADAVGAGDRVHFNLTLDGAHGGFYPTIVAVGQCMTSTQTGYTVLADSPHWTGLARVPVPSGEPWLGEVTTWNDGWYRETIHCTDMLPSGYFERVKVMVVWARAPITDLAEKLERRFPRPVTGTLLDAKLPANVASYLTELYPGRVFADPKLEFYVRPKDKCR